MKNYSSVIGALAVSFLLISCGGGGGGGQDSNSPSPSPSPDTTPILELAPNSAPYKVSPGRVIAAVAEGSPLSLFMVARQVGNSAKNPFIKVDVDGKVIMSPANVKQEGYGLFSIRASVSSALPVGKYAGTLKFSVCFDVECAQHWVGSPFKVPYNIEVYSPIGSMVNGSLSNLSLLPNGPDWSTYQGNAGHTGHVPAFVKPSDFSLRWQWSIPATAGRLPYISDMATGKDQIYFTTSDWANASSDSRQLYQFIGQKETDGGRAWMHSFSTLTYPSSNPPAYSDGRVYALAGEQESASIYGFGAGGDYLFSSAIRMQWGNYLAPVVLNGQVYNGGGRQGGMYAVDRENGLQKFFTELPLDELWSPAVDDKYAYAYSGGKLHLLDAQTGKSVGYIVDPTYVWGGISSMGAPVVGAENNVYAGNFGNQETNSIVNFDTKNMSVRWSSKGVYASGMAYADGSVFAINRSKSRLEVLNEKDGSLAWSWTPPATSSGFVGNVLLTNNLVFVSTDIAVFAVDRVSHSTVWTYPASGSLALSANGVLYIKSSHRITAINLK